jgi:hypothetical protein
MWAGCEVLMMECPEHSTVRAAQCAQCAQSVHKESVHKVCTKDKCAHIGTRVHNKYDATTIVREMYQNVNTFSTVVPGRVRLTVLLGQLGA